MINEKRRNGFSLTGVLLALAVIGLLYVVVMKTYLKNPARAGHEVQKALAEQGVDTANLSGMTRSAQEAADKASALIKQQEQNAQIPE